MKPEEYSERNFELAGWPVHLVSYRLGDKHLCKIDNVSPGAQIARAEASSRGEAERVAIEKAERRLAATRRQPVS